MAVGVGTRPIGVVMPSPWPSTSSMIHLSTRLLSPKPGQRNVPSSPLRNQFTQYSFGSLAGSADSPISSQCAK